MSIGLLAAISAACHAAPVLVAAASNVEPALSQIVARFAEETGAEVKVSYGPAITLAAQVAGGAPFELYLSANEEYPRRLKAQGYCLGEPRVYAIGAVVLWTMDSGFHRDGWLDWLRNGSGKIALPNPETTIYGQTILYILNHYQLAELLRPRFVKVRDVGRTAELVISGKVAGGFVSKSEVMRPDFRDKGRWVEIPAASYPPIRQSMILLKPAAGNPQARQLFDYLLSPQARKVWRAFGYGDG
ncbi:molybdate ABC transporter substrate-binding protein [Chromobacterium sphagni]|uniref:Molybdate ABC transporter substrate-binding protein n=1 Tax=Chromobacterium sphagni TaxID=1903179 RepID=A0A1S1WT59_9NEIS|nr:molybdate ABC transporter substrate-binding protein [Chromobacterium sphagni]